MNFLSALLVGSVCAFLVQTDAGRFSREAWTRAGSSALPWIILAFLTGVLGVGLYWFIPRKRVSAEQERLDEEFRGYPPWPGDFPMA